MIAAFKEFDVISSGHFDGASEAFEGRIFSVDLVMTSQSESETETTRHSDETE